MPESGAKSHLVNSGKAMQSADPQQSAWLSHWTGIRSETIEHDPFTQLNKTKENDLNDHDFKKHPTATEISLDNFGCSKDVYLTMNLKKPSSQSFQFFKCGQENDKCSIFNEIVQPHVSQRKLTGGLTVDTSSSEYYLQHTDQIKHHMFFGESSYLSSRPSDQVVYKLDSHTTHGLQNFSLLTAAFASQLPDSEKSEMHCSLAFIEEQVKEMKKLLEWDSFHIANYKQFLKDNVHPKTLFMMWR